MNESIWVNRTLFLALTTFKEREKDIFVRVLMSLFASSRGGRGRDEKVCAALIISFFLLLFFFFRSKFPNCTDIEQRQQRNQQRFFFLSTFSKSPTAIVSNKAKRKRGNIPHHMHIWIFFSQIYSQKIINSAHFVH